MSARFVRQVLLSEIGEAGQRRIEASCAAVAGDGLAHEIAARYATCAGFGGLTSGSIDVDALAPAAIVTSGPARDVLAGARAALAAMRSALTVTADGPAPSPGPGPRALEDEG